MGKAAMLIMLMILVTACGTADMQRPSPRPVDVQGNEPLSGGTNVGALSGGGLRTTSESVSYMNGVSGYLAKPEQGGPYPGIVMIHEWWGLNDNIKQMAEKLASQGYIVLAVDLFNGRVAATQEEARSLVSQLDNQQAMQNLKSAVSYLRNVEKVPTIGTLGWCFGGGQSLLLSINDDVDATVIYYGHVVATPEQVNSLQAPVLGIFAEQDQAIPLQTAKEFDKKLDEAGIENEIHYYPGVGHAFANPSGQNYAPLETQDAWEKTLDFLERNLK